MRPVLLEAPKDDALELRGDLGAEQPKIVGRLRLESKQQLEHRAPAERRHAGEQLEQRRAEPQMSVRSSTVRPSTTCSGAM